MLFSIIHRNYSKIYNKIPKCDFKPKAYTGPSFDELVRIRNTRINPNLQHTYYKKPIIFHQGYKQWLFDTDNKRYLDLFGGICTISVGHCHPKIIDAVHTQMKKLGHISTLYFYDKIHEYALKLTDKLPGNLKVVYFVNSGSEANDLAVLMARAYTNNHEIVTLQNCYHGMTYQTMGLTSLNGYKYPTIQPTGTQNTMNPDVYKGLWGGSHCRDSPIQTTRQCACTSAECEAKDNYVDQFANLFKYRIPKGKLAAFFAESIQGVGGTIQFPKGYLKDVQKIVKENNGLFISDEVQTGFGRTGDHYWGFQAHDITPDIVTLAKGIGNGFPLGAVVTTPEIAQALTKAAHFNTFGGNPIACAAGLAVLEVLEEEKLQENSKIVGTEFLHRLAELRDKFDVIGDVRGKGLMIGVELVKGDGTTRPMSRDTFKYFLELCKNYGVLLGCGGVDGNVIRIKPPMCITKDDVNFAVEVIQEALNEIYLEHSPSF